MAKPEPGDSDYLEQLAGDRDMEDAIRELHWLRAKGPGNSRDWRFDRDEIHERACQCLTEH